MSRRQPSKGRRHLKAVGECIVIGGAILVLAIPYACLTIYSFARYGRKFERRRGCVRRGNARRYTEEEWRKLKLPPKPEVMILDLPETPQDREEHARQEEREREDRIMGVSPTSEHTKVACTGDVTWRKWKPKRPFRFTGLPREVQILVLENLVVKSQQKKWIACAGYCKDGFVPFSLNQHLSPRENRRILMKNELALWRAGSTSTTRSLLLTSRWMREVTNAALTCTYSGDFHFHSRRRTSQLDAPWPWNSVNNQMPIFRRNKWLFDHVRTLTTSQILSVWSNVLSVMPNLERIKLMPQSVSARELSDEASMIRRWRTWETMEYPIPHGTTLRGAVIETGHHWIEWCKQRKRDGQRTVAVSVVVNTSHDQPNLSRACIDVEVQLWPDIHAVDEYIIDEPYGDV